MDVSEKNFEKIVLKSDIPVLVDFWAEWCGPCRMLSPVISELSKEMDSIKIVKVNVDENRALAVKFGIMSIPSMLIFKKGEVAGRIMGYMGKDALKNKIMSLL